ncbi:hypothetical protein LSTR_LSTR003247 [Laodelphax striatellus]|uniref:SLC26A/SulP transporter domain-containing protein n=1 Tax=Laodelphax striatellus TaxID=195883 RepID=A0A482XTV3_LAOST|nr:hypothetical protein LSTR_LSTR003247 [Laodelphax striatellus]
MANSEECDKVFGLNNNNHVQTFEWDSSDHEKPKDSCCTMECVKSRIPVLRWAPQYNLSWLISDLIAGVTVSLTAVPQGIAYAVVAGLDPAYGLYSGIMGAFVYMLLGTSKDVTVGPTAIMSLMTYKYASAYGVDYAVLLCFISGVVTFIFGLLHLGFLVEFISLPVTSGFTSAAAIIIAVSQVKNILGIDGKGNGFIGAWTNLFENWHSLRLGDTVMGFTTVILLVIAKKLKDYSSSWENRSLRGIMWQVGVARNAIVVIIGTFIAFMCANHDLQPFRLTGHVNSGLPPISLPPFSHFDGNRTVTFPEMLQNLGTGTLVAPIISILESVSIAKVFAKGKTLDASQEMIALGFSNIFGSFVQSMPITGSFTRTAVNHASGVATQFGGFFNGVMIILSLSCLTPTFYYIPKSTVAGVIICAMFYMVEYHVVLVLWRTKKMDLVPFIVTFITCLFINLEMGIVAGITVNLLFILYNSARPRIFLQWITSGREEVLLVTPTQGLVFPATEYLREVIITSCVNRGDSNAPVIIDGTHIHFIDSTMAKGIKLLLDDLLVRKQKVYLWHWNDNVVATITGFDPKLSTHFHSQGTLQQLIKGSDEPEYVVDVLSGPETRRSTERNIQ